MSLTSKIAALAIAAAAVAGVTTAAAPAFASTASTASTAECQAAPMGDCGSEVNANGGALTVTGRIAVNTAVVSEPDSATSGRSDLVADQTTNYRDERTFEVAPAGYGSGFCLSQPAGWTHVALRKCNNSRWQRWTGHDTRNTLGTQWTNVASGGVMVGSGLGHAVAVVAPSSVKNIGGSFYGFDAAGVVPAPVTQSAAGLAS